MRRVDLNADLGEGFGPWTMGDDAAMLGLVSSANVACGGHAGDADTMFETLQLAASRGVVVGAHPGYADPQGFGRRVIPMPVAAAARLVVAQVGALQAMARLAGTRVAYVKLHGALANLAAENRELAVGLVAALTQAAPDLAILAISGSILEQVARAAGRPVFSEIFADRAYLGTGQLVPRSRADAMILDPDLAVLRLIGFLDSGLMPVVDGPPIRLAADSICVHGDSPGAVAMARAVRTGLAAQGVALSPFLPL